jgi:hypothetical protein
MKLNKDCIRDILLYVEANGQLEGSIGYNQLCNELNEYEQDDIGYTLLRLKEAGYIDGKQDTYMPFTFSVSAITWNGHKFLDTVRDPKVWSTTKKIAKKFESVSITLLSNIGAKVIEDTIDKTMGNLSL